jgi:hypothetical protein
MAFLFFFLFIVSVIVLIIGLIHPRLVIRWGPEEKKTRKRMSCIGIVTSIILFICFALSVPQIPSEQRLAQQQQEEQKNQQETQQKQVEKAREEQQKYDEQAEYEAWIAQQEQQKYDEQANYEAWIPKEIERLSKETLGDEFINITINNNVGNLNSNGKIVLLHFNTGGSKIFNIEAKDIFKKLYSQNLPIDEITLFGEAGLVDIYGKTSKEVVAKCTMSKATAAQISWDNFLTKNIPNVTENYWIHPALRKEK